jgi:hypothetical protein
VTEGDWLDATDPQAMLTFLRDSGRASERKLRLLAVASYRLCYGSDLAYSTTAQRAVEVAERFADGLAGREELSRSARAASDAAWASLDAVFGHTRASEVEGAAAQVAGESAVAAAQAVPVAKYEANYAELTAAQATLLRCVFGPLPFREVHLDLAWLAWNDCIVKRLAEGIFEERAFDRMPVLADALADAGCDNEDLLRHCREPGLVHCRGCWVVDLILGKG